MTAGNDGLAGAGGPDDEVLDVVVVGGSQAGLAMAWHLARQNLRFVVLDAAPEIGHTWRSRWDSLKPFTPTQYNAGPFQVPYLPPAAQGLDSSVTQLHSTGYRNPQALPPGPVLAVGRYRPDYSWLGIPGILSDGKVIHKRGVTQIPGLYFLGLSWQHTRGSALLGFVHHDAAYLAGHITSNARASQPATARSPLRPGR